MHQGIGTRRGTWEGGAVQYSYCFFHRTVFIRPASWRLCPSRASGFYWPKNSGNRGGGQRRGRNRAEGRGSKRRPKVGAERGGVEPPAIRCRPHAAPNRHLGAFLDLLWPAAAGTISISNVQLIQGSRWAWRGGGRGGRRGFGAARGWRGPCRRIRRRRPGRRAFRVRRRKPEGPFRGDRFP